MVIRYGAFPTRKTEGLPRYLSTDISLDLQKGLHQSKDTLATHDGLGLKKKKKKKKKSVYASHASASRLQYGRLDGLAW